MLAAGQVPDPHRFIVATGDQMPPIWAESNAEHGLGMTLHTTGESAMGGGAAIVPRLIWVGLVKLQLTSMTAMHSPLAMSHTLAVPSALPVASWRPSSVYATHCTGPV